MGKFIEKSKRGEVMGNVVVCKPVPFALALAGMTAETDAERIQALAKVVEECVTMEDGERLVADELSVEAIAELGKFALSGEGTVADFT